MTRAAILDAIMLVRKERDIRLVLLGPCPAWWRPFARRRWRFRRDDILEEERQAATILWRRAVMMDAA